MALAMGFFAACGPSETADDNTMDIDTTMDTAPIMEDYQEVPVDTNAFGDTATAPLNTDPVQ